MTSDPFELARAEEMLLGYSARWHDEPIEFLAVEQEFDGPLENPETGAESRTFRLGGALDGVVRDLRTSRTLVLERKTSSEDLTPGATYWRRLTLNSQLSTYMTGARALGYEPDGILYDVLGKPAQRPSVVPLIDDAGVKIVLDAGGMRVRTKDGKKYRETADSAQGYVLQTRPETVDEYRARVREAICNEPDRYYRRGDVVRLLEEERDAAFDAWQTAASIREGRRLERWPRNPDACIRYGSVCSFFAVCTGETTIDDPLRFGRRERRHAELANDVSPTRHLPLLTNSELSAYRACTRLHHYRYDLGVEPLIEVENRRFGSLVHRGLAAWSISKQAGAPEDECVGRAIEAMRASPAARPKMSPNNRQEISL